jgi:[ribosomal protein S5]-alanine N-acetyltransferase
MEIKMRTLISNSVPGAEKWAKEKLGKSNLHSYQSKINELLDRNNISRDLDLFERNLVGEVSKERHEGSISGIYFEITFISLQFSSPQIENNRGWVSICFEASEAALSSFIQNVRSPVATLLLPCLTSLYAINRSDPLNSLSHHFYPVLSGYPAWLNAFVSVTLPSPTKLLALMEHHHVTPPCPPLATNTNIPSSLESSLFDWSLHPSLETSRLFLREITLDHVEDIFRIRENFEVTRYNIGREYTSNQQAKNLIESMTADFQQKKALRWGVVKKDDPSGRVIGMIGFNYWNTLDNRGSIGFDLNHLDWGNGYMKESLQRILHFGFNEMKLNRIEAMASAENEKSLGLLRRMGFIIEGIQREQYYEDGVYHDLVFLAILKREWLGSHRS